MVILESPNVMFTAVIQNLLGHCNSRLNLKRYSRMAYHKFHSSYSHFSFYSNVDALHVMKTFFMGSVL